MQLFFHRTGGDASQNVPLEEHIDEDGGQHDDDDAGRQGLPRTLLGIGVIHQEGGQGAQLVLGHIQVRDVHIVDDGDGLDNDHRCGRRGQQREDDAAFAILCRKGNNCNTCK